MQKNMDISQLPLSVRSRNALEKSGILKLEELMSLTELDLECIRNLGKKSIQEIVQLQQSLNAVGDPFQIMTDNVEINRESQSVKELVIRHHGGNIELGTDGYQTLVLNLFNEWAEDVHIDDLRLSARPTNALLLAGIQSVQGILNLNYRQCFKNGLIFSTEFA